MFFNIFLSFDKKKTTIFFAIASFFRGLSIRSLTEEDIQNLEEKIPRILCNLEKIFSPSFFDVMEHLPIHLPREAALGSPVQYRWMYQFEWYMFHLKKKVKNLSSGGFYRCAKHQ